MRLKNIILSLLLSSGALCSCSDVLDVAPDGTLTLEEVFADPDKVGAFLNSCYNNIPKKGFNYWF